MVAPQGRAVGAELGELYSKAKVELADVAAQFGPSRSDLVNVAPSALMTRHHELGVGFETGPAPEFLEASALLQGYLGDMEDMLHTIRLNVMATARDLADVDQETAAGFRATGGEF